MRIHAVVLALALAVAAPARSGDDGVPAASYWFSNREKGERLARKLVRPQVLLLTLPYHQASWDAYKRLQSDPRMIDLLAPLVRIHVEQPDGGYSYQRFRPSLLPLVVVLDAAEVTVASIFADPHDPCWVDQLVSAVNVVAPCPPCGPPPCSPEGPLPRYAPPRAPVPVAVIPPSERAADPRERTRRMRRLVDRMRALKDSR